MRKDTGVCLSRVRHTTMLHGCLSPGIPYSWPKSDSTTAKAHGRVLWPCDQFSMYAYLDTT
ncbi:hypothetical protein F383_37469 [Gossypium arboreum]|uniref:Uncharacterized protein n=1 Tax=Gossypium arboreum TaxID=29729 RepID=A0A0B0MHF1_GOSAR|nr:hypothetical protein F383_37469 [Gossypium arboreum]